MIFVTYFTMLSNADDIQPAFSCRWYWRYFLRAKRKKVTFFWKHKESLELSKFTYDIMLNCFLNIAEEKINFRSA